MPATAEDWTHTDDGTEVPPLPGPDKKEIAARTSALHWVEAKHACDAALSRLETGAATGFTDGDAELLIERYQDACDELDKATKGLGKTSHIPAAHRDRHEAKIEQHESRRAFHAAQAGITEADIRNRQQDFERERNRRESALAAQEMDKAGAPGLPAQPGELAQQRVTEPGYPADPGRFSTPEQLGEQRQPKQQLHKIDNVKAQPVEPPHPVDLTGTAPGLPHRPGAQTQGEPESGSGGVAGEGQTQSPSGDPAVSKAAAKAEKK